MSVTQSDLHRLHQRLIEVLGSQPAATLMELLVPGWSDSINTEPSRTIADIEQRLAQVEEHLRHLDTQLQRFTPPG